MARKNDTEAVETFEGELVAEVTEEVTAEAPVEVTEEVTAEAPVEAEVDLVPFETAVEEALGASDTSTGSVPEAEVANVREFYQSLSGIKAKNAAKAHLQNRLSGAVEAMDVATARAIHNLIVDATVAGKPAKTKATPKPKDYTEAYTSQVASILLALHLVQSEAPEGVDREAAIEAATERVGAVYEAALEAHRTGGESDNALIKSALKLAKAPKASGGRGDGIQRSIEAHIREAFASLPVGSFLTKAEIRKFKSEEYGSTPPSSGAISNRVAPKGGSGTTIEGFATDTNEKGVVGLRKVA